MLLTSCFVSVTLNVKTYQGYQSWDLEMYVNEPNLLSKPTIVPFNGDEVNSNVMLSLS